MAARLSSRESRFGRFSRSDKKDSRSSSKSSSVERSRLTSSLPSLRRVLSSNISEKKPMEPTVYLVIHNTEAKKYGLSWTIRIRMQDRADYILDVVADPKSRKGYYVHEERPQDAVLTSKFFKAIKVGTIPTNGGWAEHALEHVLCFFKTCELDKTKPHGVSIIWVTEVLEKSKMLGFLCYESGATEKIEQQTRQLEKKMKSAKAASFL